MSFLSFVTTGRNYWSVLLLSIFAWAITTGLSDAAGEAEAPALKLPATPANWINSPPLNSQMLKGKAALFYLFEEG